MEQRDVDVVNQRFEDFKNEVLRAIDGIGDRITSLSEEVKSYYKTVQQQDRQLVAHDTKIVMLCDKQKEQGTKIDDHTLSINSIQTELQTTQKNFKTALTVIGLLITLVNLLIRFWPAN